METCLSNREKPSLTLGDLLARITEENIHPEQDMGSAVGKEVWQAELYSDQFLGRLGMSTSVTSSNRRARTALARTR